MIVEDQTATIAFLKAQAGQSIEMHTTHISMVLVARERAFKLKRAVKLPYLDFSAPAQRLAACEREFELNRRTAPRLYLGVRRITREPDGRLAFDGEGPLVDALVEMRPFAQECLFDAMARAGALSPALIEELAENIARFHAQAPVATEAGGRKAIERVLDINERGLEAAGLVAPPRRNQFAAAFRRVYAKHADLLDARGRAGKIRRCHGDLNLRNICLFEGEPTLFDCIEFDEEMATIDVLYDLAFVLMDLWHRDQRRLANLLFNRYLDLADEGDGLPLLPFFMALRAAVRAHVTGAQANEAGSAEAPRLRAEAMSYFDLALALLDPPRPCLLAIGGFSGSGKSSLAESLAAELGPPPGARILNSDRLRKRRFGVAPEARLPADAYAPEASQAVYAELREKAAAILAAGHAVIADAVFDRPDERHAIEAVASGSSFHGVWLVAPADVLSARVGERKGGPSDATTSVLAEQLRRGAGSPAWHHIDAARDLQSIAEEARAHLSRCLRS